MILKSKETMKSFILLILLLASIIQVGILWNYQNHGFPISFFASLFNKQSTPASTTGEEYFRPYSITVSSGDEAYWIVDSKSDNYDKLWNDLKNSYLPQLLTNARVAQVYSINPDDEWVKIITGKSFIFDFKTRISSELIQSFMNLTGASGKEPYGVYKIALSPWEDVNNNQTIYLYDGGKIYKYILPFNSKGMNSDTYEKIFEYYYNQNNNQRQYNIISDLVPAGKGYVPVGPDVFLAASGSSYDDYYTYTCSAPDILKNDPQSGSTLLVNAVIGSDKGIYDYAGNFKDKLLVIQNINNLYKVHNDGLLEYKYVSSPGETQKVGLAEAFRNAVEFIAERKQLVQGASIYLSGIDESNRDYMEFTFDYMLDGIPVFVDHVNTSDGQTVNNAITIRADSKRVISAIWVMKKFEKGKTTSKYNVNFSDFTFRPDYNKMAISDKNFFMKDLNIAYVLNSVEDTQTLEPSWVISALDNKFYVLPAVKKGGG